MSTEKLQEHGAARSFYKDINGRNAVRICQETKGTCGAYK